MMKRSTLCVVSVLALVLLAATDVLPHERETTSVTWNQTISRIMIDRCGSCHREGGTSFSLLTYDDARPWAVAIRDEILARTMPPWGAVKGFGEFRNDSGLSPAQTNLIVSWVEGGVPEGNESDLPEEREFAEESDAVLRPDAVMVTGAHVLAEPLTLDGIWPRELPEGASFQIVAEIPDGPVQPLLWLYEYREMYGHPFFLKNPVELPAGTVIRGVPSNASIAMMPPGRE